MSVPNRQNAAPANTGDGVSNSAFERADIETKSNGFDTRKLNLYSVNSQAVRFVARRFAKPISTAALIAALAGLGGADG